MAANLPVISSDTLKYLSTHGFFVCYAKILYLLIFAQPKAFL